MPTIIVESGSGLADANSYISEVNADAYFLDRGISAWGTAAVSTRQSALITATQYLDAAYRSRWKGKKYSTTQRLDWPRVEVFDRDGNELDEAILPRSLVEATAEAALKVVQ